MRKLVNELNLNNYLDKKSSLLTFLLLFMGVLVPAVSGYWGTNVWEKLLSILSSPIFNMMFFLAMGYVILKSTIELSQNYFYISRYSNYSQMLKKNLKTLIILIIWLTLVSLILALAGAIIFSLGNISIEKYSEYNISSISYIIFRIFRGIIFNSCLVVNFYSLFLILKKEVYKFFIFIFSSLYFFSS